MPRSSAAQQDRPSDSEALVSHGVLAQPLMVPDGTPEQSVSGVQLAKHLDLTQQRVNQLSRDNVLPKNRDGTFPIDSARVAYLRSLRRAASVRTKRSTKGDDVQDTKLAKAKLDLAIAQGEVVKIIDVEAKFTEAFGALRNELAGLGASVTRDLQLRAAIDEKVNDAVDRVRATLEAAAEAGFDDSSNDVESEEASA